jgi:hypothetical protein
VRARPKRTVVAQRGVIARTFWQLIDFVRLCHIVTAHHRKNSALILQRAINCERVLSGIARAKAEGVVLGRPCHVRFTDTADL